MFGHVLIQVNLGGFMLRLICMFVGCDLTIQLLLESYQWLTGSIMYTDLYTSHIF